MTEKKKRVRRSTATVRALILSAARELFAERGYRASTRDIAKLAGVTEAVIFRQFGSKARLFESIFSEPVTQFYETFYPKHHLNSKDPRLIAKRSEDFTKEIFSLLSENRELVFAYLSAIQFEPEIQGSKNGLRDCLEMAVKNLEQRYEYLGIKPSIPPSMTIRFGFVTFVGVVMFHNWIFEEGELDQKKFIKALNHFVLPDFQIGKGEAVKPAKAAKAKAAKPAKA